MSENIKFRLGGLVENGSLIKSSGKKIYFKITDNENSITTSYEGILPDLFAENQGVIASGKYINGVFVAEEILAKHDESYLPKEVIEILKKDGTYIEPDK
jgi:cytochrome c-type biogenesis protein CcmE